MSGDEDMVSREHMENMISMARVETMLSGHREDFLEHSAKDDKSFNELYTISREVKKEIGQIPQKMSECRQELKIEVVDDIKENFVSKASFDIFTTKIVYSILGGIGIAGVIQWVLSNYISVSKIAGAGG